MADGTFRNDIYDLIAKIPRGSVVTYGDLAALAGHPNASRIVGGIAHYGDINLPWHRLVNRFGGLASGFPGGRDVQMQLLLQDGTSCNNYIVDNFKDIRWKPIL
ncbi:MAG: MGMT family protein [Candidatus Saccharibacteria bacterium]